MKTQREPVQPDANSSFRLLRNPRLSDLFYWHFHPEFELVYIEGADGTRHVGDHISPYQESDLVLIGSNIPHLNFDYGVKTDYEKVVLQIQPGFQQTFLQTYPELSGIHRLFDQSAHGIAFSGKTKLEVGQRLKAFHLLSPFEQFLEVLSMLQLLAQDNDATLLHEQAYINRSSEKEQERLKRIYTFIEEHYEDKITIDEVAELCNLGKPAFCRYFKKATGSTFIEFLNQYRISQAKRSLLMGNSVGDTCYECGFESLSYFTRTFTKIAQESPSKFQQRHKK